MKRWLSQVVKLLLKVSTLRIDVPVVAGGMVVVWQKNKSLLFSQKRPRGFMALIWTFKSTSSQRFFSRGYFCKTLGWILVNWGGSSLVKGMVPLSGSGRIVTNTTTIHGNWDGKVDQGVLVHLVCASRQAVRGSIKYGRLVGKMKLHSLESSQIASENRRFASKGKGRPSTIQFSGGNYFIMGLDFYGTQNVWNFATLKQKTTEPAAVFSWWEICSLILQRKPNHPGSSDIDPVWCWQIPWFPNPSFSWVVATHFFIFNPTWGLFPFWLIFFKWVETTNQFWPSILCQIFRVYIYG